MKHEIIFQSYFLKLRLLNKHNNNLNGQTPDHNRISRQSQHIPKHNLLQPFRITFIPNIGINGQKDKKLLLSLNFDRIRISFEDKRILFICDR